MKPAVKIGLGVAGAAVLAGIVAVPLALRNHVKPDASVERGHALAVEYCSRCHAVEPGKTSPVADAPPFYTFAQRWPLEDLEEALAEGIMVSHQKYQMPVFQFDPDQIADFIAYLRTIQVPAPKAPEPAGAPGGGN